MELKKTVAVGFLILKCAKTHILQNSKIYVILELRNKIDNRRLVLLSFFIFVLRLDKNNILVYNVSMNRNKNKLNSEMSSISEILSSMHNQKNVCNFLLEILTEAEVETLSKRWRILTMLAEGKTQREIAQDLQVSLCKVTRGSKILKNKKSVVTKYLTKEK